MRLVIGRFLILVGMAWPLHLTGQSSPCDQVQPLIQPLPGSTIQYKDRGNRCEGFYSADVGAMSIQLVSLTEGIISYELTNGVRLQLSAPGQVGSVHVRALAKPLRTYYRMDATLQGGTVLNWPVNDVLLPGGLSADRIGVQAWKTDGGDTIYVPVRVTVASSAGAPIGPATTYLSVRPSFDVETIKWRSAMAIHGSCSSFSAWQDAPRNQVLAGQVVDISLKGLYGERCIEVAARRESSNDWSTMSVHLELPLQ